MAVRGPKSKGGAHAPAGYDAKRWHGLQMRLRLRTLLISFPPSTAGGDPRPGRKRSTSAANLPPHTHPIIQPGLPDHTQSLPPSVQPQPGVRPQPRVSLDPAPDQGVPSAAKQTVLRLPPNLEAVLMGFQRDGVRYALERDGRCILGDQMGLGKTLQAISIMWHYRAVWPLLVVAPSSMRGCWIDELEKWLPGLAPWDFNVIRSGKDVKGLGSSRITVVTYGLLAQPDLLAHVAQANFRAIICDESHYIKSRKAKRTQSLLPLLKKAKHVLLLSGTPALSRPEELFTQIDALRPGLFGSFSKFAERYCDAKRDRFGYNTRGASHLDELHARLSESVMIRRLKADVLDQLPPKRRQRVDLQLSEEALREVRAGMDELDAWNRLPDGDPFDRNRVITGLYSATSAAKVAGVADYVDFLCKSGEKFLVFAYHKTMFKALETAVVKAKAGYIMITGETPGTERAGLVNRFQHDASW